MIWKKFTNASEVLDASIIVFVMETARNSGTLENFCETIWRNNLKDSFLLYFSRDSISGNVLFRNVLEMKILLQELSL